jgi:FkbM family methyltransferase
MFVRERFPLYVSRVGPCYLFQNDWITRWILCHGSWEPYLLDEIDKHVNAESVVMDVGAHVGLHTVYLSKRAKKVYAFEPVPETFEILCQNVELNQCPNVETLPFGLADTPQELDQIYLPDHCINFGCARITPLDTISTPYPVHITLERLDDVCPGLDRLDFIKVDIEGAERLFFEGARQTLELFRPTLIVENFSLDDDPFVGMGYERTQLLTKHGEPSSDYLYVYP